MAGKIYFFQDSMKFFRRNILKFHEYTVKIIRADIEENGAAHWLPEWDAIEKYYAWRNQVKDCPPLPSKRPTRRAVKSAGVETWMAKCPNPNCTEEPKRM